MSDAVILALIKEIGGWLATLGSIVGAVLGAWALVQSRKTTQAVKEQKAEVQQTVEVLHAKAEETQAIAAHAQSEMASSREENRKLHQFIDTEVFMAQATAPTDSGRHQLEPLTDFADMKLEDKP